MRKKKLPPGVCDISRKTGISPAHISKIFNGYRMPSLENAALIASALKITLDELYMQLVQIRERMIAAQEAAERVAAAMERDRLREGARNGQEVTATA